MYDTLQFTIVFFIYINNVEKQTVLTIISLCDNLEGSCINHTQAINYDRLDREILLLFFFARLLLTLSKFICLIPIREKKGKLF